MKVYGIKTAAKAFEKAARRYPSSYIRVIRLILGYDLILVKLIKTEGEENDSTSSSIQD